MVGGSWSTRREPKQTWGEHIDYTHQAQDLLAVSNDNNNTDNNLVKGSFA